MVEELKVIAEIFKNATDGALYAYLAYISYSLVKVSIITFPIISCIKFIVARIFIEDKNENKQNK